ncbi:uncharacterized protein LOC113648041 isoform X1 [Tachysurus fulvidraco]|uniref:uncharacterized protein LOC113648041 isoform X1 n=1 Tax=Tachysurus fulvidraco TaxID=1234273 RepID=UPI001FEEB945|nr:uncharacterized protein LOC113648041 isoform X1 [Tachysurus fulvidraco]
MYAFRKLFISCVVMLWMNWTLSEVPYWCCFERFTNKSVMFTVNTTKHCIEYIWKNEETPIADEKNNVDYVVHKGPNWILLNGNVSGINFRCMDPDNEIITRQCTDPCDSGKADTFMDVDSDHDDGHGGDGGDGGRGGDGGHGGDRGDEGPGGDGDPDSKAVIASVAVISVAVISVALAIIIWKSGRYRRCCANRPEANHANGGFQAVGQVDQQESNV